MRSPDVRHGFIDFENGESRYYEKSSFSKYRLDDGDILVIKSNGSLDLVGKSQVYFSNPKYPNVTASNFLMILKPDKDLVSPLYLDVFLKSPQSLIWRVEKQRTTTGLRNLDSKGYLSLEIPLPETLDEQEVVTDIINKLIIHEFPKNEIFDISTIELASKISERFNELLDEYERNKNLLADLKQSILQEAIQGKLTADWRAQNSDTEPASELLKRIKAEKAQLIKDKKIKKEKPIPPNTEDEIPFEIPEGWVWCTLDDVSLFKNGKAHEKHVDPKGKYILINSKFVSTNGRVAKYTGNQMMPMYCDEIAIVMSDVPNGRALSRCFMVDAENKYSLNQRIGGIVSLTGVYHNFLIKVLDRNRHYLCFNDGKKQTNLKKSQVMSCPIPLPPFEEQKAIVEKVETLMQKCTALEEEIKSSEANAKMLMQAVLKEAFEGK